MTQILHGRELAQKILKLFEEDEPIRCAVAFWGPQIAKLAKTNKAIVILDLSMRGNSQNALKELGAPVGQKSRENLNIRALDGLHSKIYIGEKGAIIGSANASSRALGSHDVEDPNSLESGVWVDKEQSPDLYCQLEALFAGYKAKSRVVTWADVDAAPLRPMQWAAHEPPSGLDKNRPSLFNKLRATPDKFLGTVFIVCDEDISTQEIKNGNEAYQRECSEEKTFANRSIISTISGEESSALPKNPERIILYWLGRNGDHIQAYHDIRLVYDQDGGRHYFGIDSWATVKKQLNLPRSWTRPEIWGNDRKTAKEILEKGKWWVASADEVHEWLENKE